MTRPSFKKAGPSQAAPKSSPKPTPTESKAKRPSKKRSESDAPVSHTFEFAGNVVPAGTIARIEQPVARLPTGTWVSLPVMVMVGARPGPVVWLSAAVHGDELNGVVVVDELVRLMDPQQMSGVVLAVPVVNAFGLIQGSRYLPDRRDLNRLFPGSKRGSLGARLANLFTELVIERAELGVDFHTGSGGRENLPQIRCNLDDPKTRSLAGVFGAPVALHSALRDGSLRAHAANLGKPVLLFEAGEAGRLDDEAISMGVAGTLRVLAAVGVLNSPPRAARHPTQLFRTSSWVRANRSGFCRLEVELGDWVVAGDSFGSIINPAQGSRHPIRTRCTGVVIGKTTEGLVTAGDAVIHVAETDDALRE